MPSWSDKLLQQVIRLLLEAFYEPAFNDHSHGFRPEWNATPPSKKSYHNWVGTVWFVEADIQACSDCSSIRPWCQYSKNVYMITDFCVLLNNSFKQDI